MSIIREASNFFQGLTRAGVFSLRPASGGSFQGDGAAGSAVSRRVDPVAAAAGGASMRSWRSVGEASGVDARHTVRLDLDRLTRSGRIVPPHARTPQAEEFRNMKRQLLRNARMQKNAYERMTLIMVTSSLPREGKTFCAINLALSMAAEIDTSVLLVDADVLQPSVMSRLGIEAEKGLLDVLSEQGLELDDVILQTNVPKLSILPAGTRNAMSSELLACSAMEALLSSLAESDPTRVVIFDTPPLLLANEAKVLASRVGQVLLVVEASTTPRSAVGHSLAALEDCPVVMSVLNKAHQSAVPYGYGY